MVIVVAVTNAETELSSESHQVSRPGNILGLLLPMVPGFSERPT
jgi:hypothetical protein